MDIESGSGSACCGADDWVEVLDFTCSGTEWEELIGDVCVVASDGVERSEHSTAQWDRTKVIGLAAWRFLLVISVGTSNDDFKGITPLTDIGGCIG